MGHPSRRPAEWVGSSDAAVGLEPAGPRASPMMKPWCPSHTHRSRALIEWEGLVVCPFSLSMPRCVAARGCAAGRFPACKVAVIGCELFWQGPYLPPVCRRALLVPASHKLYPEQVLPRSAKGFLPACLARLAVLPPRKLALCNLEAAQTGLPQLKPKPDAANRHPDRAQSSTCSPSMGIIRI